MLGQIVTVIIDREMGTFHPEHPNLFYPINYGYIQGTFAPDGEEQDAYEYSAPNRPAKRRK